MKKRINYIKWIPLLCFISLLFSACSSVPRSGSRLPVVNDLLVSLVKKPTDYSQSASAYTYLLFSKKGINEKETLRQKELIRAILSENELIFSHEIALDPFKRNLLSLLVKKNVPYRFEEKFDLDQKVEWIHENYDYKKADQYLARLGYPTQNIMLIVLDTSLPFHPSTISSSFRDQRMFYWDENISTIPPRVAYPYMEVFKKKCTLPDFNKPLWNTILTFRTAVAHAADQLDNAAQAQKWLSKHFESGITSFKDWFKS